MRSTILLLGCGGTAAIIAATFAGCGGDAAGLCDFGECDAPAKLDTGVQHPDDAAASTADGGGDEAGDDGGASDGTAVDGFAACDASTPDQSPCVVDESYGVFVAPTGDDGNAGTRSAPFATIQKGIAAASARASKLVFVCGDTYLAPISVTAANDGVSVFGALACPTGPGTGWTYTAGLKAVVAPVALGPALTITGVAGGVSFTDVELDAKPATASGGSSVAALVNASTATFTRVTFNAGDGANGGDGAATSNYTGATASGGNAALNQSGGGSVSCKCGSNESSVGGLGGSGDTVTPSDGKAGSGGPAGAPPNDGAGGGGATATADCTNGHHGGAGGDGAGGAAAVLTLGLSATGLTESGGVGGDGKNGKVAQGGGGGGGGLYIGAASSGGGGGACGGCGGGGGTGGTPGGSSVALASVGSTLTLTSCKLVSGKAGKGGKGGDGQAGQAGGGKGAQVGNGCPGGQGGNGGAGAGGAGGAGGSSLAIAYTGTAPVADQATSLQPGDLGAGGDPGAPGGAKGGDGVSAGELSL